MTKKKRISDAVEIMDRHFGGDPEWDQMVAEEELKAQIAEFAYKLREDAGLTQSQLAAKVGVTQAMISKLENADYEGSSLDLFWRVCMGLHKRIELRSSNREQDTVAEIRVPA